MQQHFKNRYHPMYFLMFQSNMLTPEQVKSIPRTTRNNWNNFSHENYFGYEEAKDYIADFDYIKEVLTNKHLKQGVKLVCTMSSGYRKIVNKIEKSKKLLREHSEDITFSIERIAKQGNVKITDACKLFGVSKNWFYRHRKKAICSNSKINKCFHQYPNQLTFKEVSKIENIVSNIKNLGKTKTTLYFDAMRKKLIVCGLSTFFKYADMLGYTKIQKKKANNPPPGFRATKTFQWLHVDVTHVQTQNDGIQYVAFVKDNYSKALLGYKSTDKKPKSGFIRELFQEVFENHQLLKKTNSIHILSDGGSENKGDLLHWINQIKAPPTVKKLTARTDEFPYSNSMAESTHSIYKTEFLKGKHSIDKKQHLKDLETFFSYYNEERYPFEFYGLTPKEVLNGEKPDKSKFKKQIKQAQKKRLEENRKFNECPLMRI